MRFEIKSGGMVAILLGVTGLSGAVFLFGLLSGYDVGRESQSSAAQVATAYPVEPPPAAAAASPAAAPSPAIAAAPAPAAPSAPASPPGMAADDESAAPVAPVAAAKPARTKHTKTAHTSAAAAASSSERIAETDVSSPAGGMGAPSNASDEDDATSAADTGSSSTEAPPPAAAVSTTHPGAVASAHPSSRHKPYTIQIQAAMDRNSASAMVQRLKALGFQPYTVPTLLNGQTWYRVVIGPFATQEAAAAAQQEMRAKYNSTYSGSGYARPSGTSD
jgi:cell division septation protein DedD